MPRYYVRHDGTQTNKSAALLGGVAAAALSIAGLNASAFLPGDEIYLERSGVYTTNITFNHTGTADNPIVLTGPGPDDSSRAKFKVSGVIGALITGNYIHVKNMHIIADSDDCFMTAVGSGDAGDGRTIKYYDCVAENTNGDGFGTGSNGSSTTQCEWIRCEARLIIGANNQGFTNHDNQRTTLTDCKTTPSCETAMTFIGDECIVNGGEFYAYDTVFFASGGCALTINNAKGYVDALTSTRLVRASNAATRIVFNDCELYHMASSTNFNSIVGDDVQITFNGGSFYYEGTNTSAFEFGTGAAGSLVQFTGGCRVSVGNMGLRFIRTLTTGGAFRFDGCIVDLSRASAAGSIVFLESRTTSNALLNWIRGCLILGDVPDSFVFARINDGTVSSLDVFNNTFVGLVGSNTDCIATSLSSATATLTVRSNIFHNCSDAIQGTTGVVKDYNVYSGTTPNESDTNGLTSDPQFRDAANGDYTLLAVSPCRESGRGTVSALDAAGKSFKNPPSRGCYEYNSGIRSTALTRVARSA